MTNRQIDPCNINACLLYETSFPHWIIINCIIINYDELVVSLISLSSRHCLSVFFSFQALVPAVDSAVAVVALNKY